MFVYSAWRIAHYRHCVSLQDLAIDGSGFEEQAGAQQRCGVSHCIMSLPKKARMHVHDEKPDTVCMLEQTCP